MPVLTLDYRHCDRKRPKYVKHIEIEGIAALARRQLVGSGLDAIPFDALPLHSLSEFLGASNKINRNTLLT